MDACSAVNKAEFVSCKIPASANRVVYDLASRRQAAQMHLCKRRVNHYVHILIGRLYSFCVTVHYIILISDTCVITPLSYLCRSSIVQKAIRKTLKSAKMQYFVPMDTETDVMSQKGLAYDTSIIGLYIN